MNDLKLNKEVMTSREIADLTGKEHKNVMQDIRNLVAQLPEKDRLNFQLTSYTDSQNRGKPMYQLSKKGCLCLASGYRADLRMAIINRWEELEKEKRSGNFVIPSTFSEALMLAAKQAEEIEKQQKQIECMKPKAEYFNGLVERGNNLNFRDTAKLLGVKEKTFIYILIDKGYVYRDAKGKLKPIAKYVGKYFELKEWVTNDKSGTQTLITVTGREKFASILKEYISESLN